MVVPCEIGSSPGGRVSARECCGSPEGLPRWGRSAVGLAGVGPSRSSCNGSECKTPATRKARARRLTESWVRGANPGRPARFTTTAEVDIPLVAAAILGGIDEPSTKVAARRSAVVLGQGPGARALAATTARSHCRKEILDRMRARIRPTLGLACAGRKGDVQLRC
jgi:hypothetical protein